MTKVSEFDATGCRRYGAHDVTARHTLSECPVYQAANTPEDVCTECGAGEYAHMRDCSVLAAEAGKKKVSDDLLSYAHEAYERAVRQTAESLREIANDFEREALDTATFTHAPRVRASARALHTLNWGIANANVESVVRQASETDEIAERANR